MLPQGEVSQHCRHRYLCLVWDIHSRCGDSNTQCLLLNAFEEYRVERCQMLLKLATYWP